MVPTMFAIITDKKKGKDLVESYKKTNCFRSEEREGVEKDISSH